MQIYHSHFRSNLEALEKVETLENTAKGYHKNSSQAFSYFFWDVFPNKYRVCGSWFSFFVARWKGIPGLYTAWIFEADMIIFRLKAKGCFKLLDFYWNTKFAFNWFLVYQLWHLFTKKIFASSCSSTFSMKFSITFL